MVVTKNIELFKQDNMYTYITLNNMFNFLSDLIFGLWSVFTLYKGHCQRSFFYNFFSLFRDFEGSIQRYQWFFSELPEMLCESEMEAEHQACWSGQDIAERYLKHTMKQRCFGEKCHLHYFIIKNTHISICVWMGVFECACTSNSQEQGADKKKS